MPFDPIAIPDVLKNNSMLSAALGLWGAAMLTFITKDIPSKIGAWMKRTLTTHLELSNSEPEFTALTSWVEGEGLSYKFRTLRVRSGEVSAGHSVHYFLRHGRLFWLRCYRIEEKSYEYREELLLSCFGRCQKPLRDLLEEARLQAKGRDSTEVYMNRYCRWVSVQRQPKRALSSVIMTAQSRKRLTDHLDRFYKSRDWYRRMGIPYRTGLCLYGAPGTGKTSLVRAICAQYGLSLYVIDLPNADDYAIKMLLAKAPPKAVVLLEDIDAINISADRQGKRDKPASDTDSNVLTLSGLLNAIDGVIESDGRLLILTTNYIEKLDPALLRSGRVDLKVKMGFMTPEMIHEAVSRFFPGAAFDSSMAWRNDVPASEFQRLVLEGRGSAEIVQRLCETTADVVASVVPCT